MKIQSILFVLMTSLFFVSCIVKVFSIKGEFFQKVRISDEETHFFAVKNNNLYILKIAGQEIQCAHMKIRGVHDARDSYDAEIELVNKFGDSFDRVGSTRKMPMSYNEDMVSFDSYKLLKDKDNNVSKIISKVKYLLDEDD